MKLVLTFIMVIILACIYVSISGCTTLRESRGYLHEDVGNLIYDLKESLCGLKKIDSWIREHLW